MNLKKTICFFLFLFAMKANACLNIFAIDSAGRVHLLEHYFFIPLDFKKTEVFENIKKLEKKFSKGDLDYKNISDYGVYLLMAGNYTEGLRLFTALLQKHSDVYEIRANIAVAYELNGRFDSAYYWEKKALELQPGAHENTEWIHLKILEARIKTAADSNWCLANNVTGIYDLVKTNYTLPINEHWKSTQLFEDFITQLTERFPFTVAEDRVMGKLMMELGDAYKAVSAYRSYYCYAIAKYLYPALGSIADEKMKVILVNYPKKTVVSDGYTIPLSRKSGKDREMVLPDDAELKNFIEKLNHRSSVKRSMEKMVDINLLLSKI